MLALPSPMLRAIHHYYRAHQAQALAVWYGYEWHQLFRVAALYLHLTKFSSVVSSCC